MSKNPDWTRDELILALDLFFCSGRKQLDASHSEVIQLSQLLNQLPIHKAKDSEFRNAQGVSMKLGNFLGIDPEYSGMGLAHGSKLDQEIWNEFAHDTERLKLTAASIRESASWDTQAKLAYDHHPDDEVFSEGKILTELHKRKERNRKATEQKKRKILQETGKLECEACGFDFVVMYGRDLGYGFAECHHTVPISELTQDYLTRLADLAIVCANCHRMIHRSRPMLTVEKLRIVIESSRR